MHTNPQSLVDLLNAHSTSWYRDLWRGTQDFVSLPLVRRRQFIETPLSRRRYVDDRSLVKIVHAGDGPFLSEWAFAHIGQEPWGVVSDRPMVYLTDPHSAIEKSMWCYEQNRVPLIGEKNADIASVAATKYDIDSLIADPASVLRLLPCLKSRTKPLVALSLVGESFDPADLAMLRPYAEEIRLVLAFSETGVLGVAPLSDAPIFTAPDNTLVESVDGELVFTKLAMLATPIIRYGSGIRGVLKDGGSFVVENYGDR